MKKLVLFLCVICLGCSQEDTSKANTGSVTERNCGGFPIAHCPTLYEIWYRRVNVTNYSDSAPINGAYVEYRNTFGSLTENFTTDATGLSAWSEIPERAINLIGTTDYVYTPYNFTAGAEHFGIIERSVAVEESGTQSIQLYTDYGLHFPIEYKRDDIPSLDNIPPSLRDRIRNVINNGERIPQELMNYNELIKLYSSYY